METTWTMKWKVRLWGFTGCMWVHQKLLRGKYLGFPYQILGTVCLINYQLEGLSGCLVSYRFGIYHKRCKAEPPKSRDIQRPGRVWGWNPEPHTLNPKLYDFNVGLLAPEPTQKQLLNPDFWFGFRAAEAQILGSETNMVRGASNDIAHGYFGPDGSMTPMKPLFPLNPKPSKP